jgi:L-ascorbate metabolism protein UlaG (beta-lactamase superfamily)
MKKLLLILFLITITSCFSFGEGSPEENSFFREKKYSITWGGHSTVLIEINGKRILTDPLLTENVAGLFSRKETCKLNLEDIPKVDIILLSHSHFDHLCLNSLEILEKKYPGAKLVFPEGVEDFLPDLDFDMHRLRTNENFKNSVVGESVEIDGVKISSVYAKHSGGRYGLDSYFWEDKGHTGFIIKYNEVSVYYSGDTGYDPVAFKRIGEKYKIDAALIQTGPCFDCDIPGTDEHASSVEALNIFIDLKANYMVPVHYGSIEYDTDADYPVWVLKEIINKKYKSLVTAGNNDINYDINFSDRIIILDEGEKTILY